MAISVISSARSVGTGSRLIGTLFFGVFFLMGLFFEVMIVRQTVENFGIYNWTQAEAVIVSSSISPPRSNEHDPELHVRYSFTFRGEQRICDRIEAGSVALETGEAYRLAERYAPGSLVPCWVNPDNPGDAVLQRKSRATGLMALFPLIFVGVGVIGIWAMWRRKTEADDGAGKPISSRTKSTKAGHLTMAAFFGVFLLVGCGVTYPVFVRPVLKILAARSWTEVPCEIVSSRVKTNSDSDGNTYRVDVVYRYTYQSRTYTSNRYHFMTGSSSGYEGKAAAVRKFPAGSQATCYVDPAAPAEAVLDRNAAGDLWIGLIPLVFVAVGAGGLIFVFRQQSAASSSAFSPATGLRASLGGVSGPVTGGADNGPRTLKPASSPRGKLFGVIAAALFWNGIVSVFLVNLITTWRHGGGFSWFLGLFLTPFVAVGLGLIGGVLYQFMALFNPRPRLSVSRGALLPGDCVTITWEVEGRAAVLQRLQISLEGREEATYRRGTDTRTDKGVFATIQIADTTDGIAMRSGSAKLHVPPGAMHSFKSANNKIVWVLKVHGDIPRWPDVKDEYPVEVIPFPIAK